MLKLGKDTGSLVNYLSQQNGFHKPQVGEDVTELLWTDRSAYRCVAVDRDGKGATLKRYDAKYIGKCYGDERYQFCDENGNPMLLEGSEIHVRWRYNRWKVETQNHFFANISLAWGERSEYRDPSF